jgi:carbamoylphosphate synthase small subunit
MQTRQSTAPLPRPDAATLRRLAVAHDVDPRSIVRELREPGSVRGMAGARARVAARELRRETP